MAKKASYKPKVGIFIRMHIKVGKKVAYRPLFADGTIIGICSEIDGDYISIDTKTQSFKKCHLAYCIIIFADGIEISE